MSTDLKPLINRLRKSKITGVEDCVVRELDETSPGSFEGYVDERDQTFDIRYTITPGGKLENTHCDCTAKGVCRHIAASILNAPQHQKLAGKKNKAVSTTGNLLENITTTELKEWLLEIFPKHKDIELAFVQRFGDTGTDLDPLQVQALTDSAVKAVLGRKRKIDATSAKKLAMLWKEVHQPVVDAYFAQPFNEKAFGNFFSILMSTTAVANSVNTSSNQLHAYIARLTEKAQQAVTGIDTNKNWQTAMDLLFGALETAEYYLKSQMPVLLAGILNGASKERQAAITPKAMELYRSFDSYYHQHDPALAIALLSLLQGSQSMEQYIDEFKPLRYQNKYNLMLISELIRLRQFDQAEKYAWAQVNSNLYSNYDQPYLTLLNEIYQLTGDKSKLVPLLRQTIPVTLDFNDYLRLEELSGDDPALIPFRNQLVATFRHPSKARHIASQHFLFALMEHEQNYLKMVEYVNDDTFYSVMASHIDRLLETNADGILVKLLNRPDVNLINEKTEVQDVEAFYAGSIAQTLIARLGSKHLQKLLKQRYVKLPHNLLSTFIK